MRILLTNDDGIHAPGFAALERIARQQPPYDAVLMDLQMPGMDGLEATRRIRAQPELAGLPVIAMTAHAMPEERRQCMDAGMNEHIAKPVDPEKLYRALLEWLGGEATNVLMDAETKSGDS